MNFVQYLLFLKKKLLHNCFSCILFATFFRTLLMVASVNKTPKDEIDSDTSFHFCNSFSKLNRMLKKEESAFSKN